MAQFDPLALHSLIIGALWLEITRMMKGVALMSRPPYTLVGVAQSLLT